MADYFKIQKPIFITTEVSNELPNKKKLYSVQRGNGAWCQFAYDPNDTKKVDEFKKNFINWKKLMPKK